MNPLPSTEKVLYVDDEKDVVAVYEAGLRPRFRLDTASGAREALDLLTRNGPYAVIMSDMQMPGMDGIQLLSRVRELAPSTVRMMVTGHPDLGTAIDAVNQGSVFRFLTKPCHLSTMAAALIDGIRQYQLVTGERVLLEKTLSGAIHILLDVLGLLSPVAYGRASRVRRLVRQLAAELGVDTAWQVEVAAMLSQLGCLAIPGQDLERIYRGKRLTDLERRMFERHPEVGRDLIARIPRLEDVADILAHQEQRYDGSALPDDGVRGDELPIGARVLKVALDYDSLLLGKLGGHRALSEMRPRAGWYDPAVLDALERVLAADGVQADLVCRVEVGALKDGMLFAEDVRSVSGSRIVAKGHEVTWSLRMRLMDIADRGALVQPLEVFLPPAG